MKSTATLLSLLIVSLPLLSNAQATRTWVSGVGDDANPGSRTAPCKTFAGAISKTAPGGVIDVLDPGGFGALTITKSITIDGDAAEGGVLVSGTSGIVIAAGATDVVTLRNLSFEGLGSGLSGIRINSAGVVNIENCRINGFVDSGILYGNDVGNALLFVKDTIVHRCSTNGIGLVPTAASAITIQHVNITDCGDGIDVGTNATATVLDTVVSGNDDVGINSSGLVRLWNSKVVNNGGEGLEFNTNSPTPGQIVSYRNNVVTGNNPNGQPSSLTTPN